MNRASASRLLAVATACCAVVLLGACQTVRTSKWRKGSTGVSKYEQRMDKTVRRNIDELNALASGDESVGYTHSSFDQKTDIDTESGLFRKKAAADGKAFSAKDFAGADEYKSQDYQFLKRQNYNAQDSPDQERRFDTGTAPDQKKSFFDRFKRAPTKDYADSTKIAPSNDYRDTKLELERLEDRIPNIVQDEAADDGAVLTVDDVRTMLHGAN